MSVPATSEDFRTVVREAIHLSGVTLPRESVIFMAGLLAPALYEILQRIQAQERAEVERRHLRATMLTLPPEKRLTMEECTILRLTAQGLTTERIAAETGLTPDVVRYRRKAIYIKWRDSNPLRVVVQGIHLGLLDTADLLPETLIGPRKG